MKSLGVIIHGFLHCAMAFETAEQERSAISERNVIFSIVRENLLSSEAYDDSKEKALQG